MQEGVRERARAMLDTMPTNPLEGFIAERREACATVEDLAAVDELERAARRIKRMPTRRGKQRARPESVILSNAVYESAELEARLGRTLWRRIRKAVPALVRGRYAGAAVQAAIDAGAAVQARVLDIHKAPKRARREKNHGKNSTGAMQVRIARNR